MVIFAELYIILHGHAVSNNRLADFCRPLFPINLSRTGFQLYEIDDLSKNAAWFHLAKKVFWLESCIEFIIPLLYLIVIMPAKLENQTNDLSFAILFWNEGRNLLVSDSSQMFSDLSIIRHLMIGPSKIHLKLEDYAQWASQKPSDLT